MRRTIDASEITRRIRDAIWSINYHTPKATMEGLEKALAVEPSPAARDALRQIVDNRRISSGEEVPMCQDTGMAILFVEMGEEVSIAGAGLRAAIDQAVREAYSPLRKSVVEEPLFERRNTGDNTPAIVHIDLVAGDRLKIIVASKGFGAENMSSARLFPPSAGIDGIKQEVLRVVEAAGPNACPPVVVGVGVGGDLEVCALIAKRALMRSIGSRHPDPRYAALERELLELVNRTGIGAQGLGGRVTALDVRIEHRPTHIGALPVAVNLDCHLQRHEAILF